MQGKGQREQACDMGSSVCDARMGGVTCVHMWPHQKSGMCTFEVRALKGSSADITTGISSEISEKSLRNEDARILP